MNTFNMPNIIPNGFRGYGNDDDRYFALPLLAGLALTAPFWAGGFYGRRCCPPRPYYPAPYPVPTPYPYPYTYPSPYSYYNRVPYTIY